MLYSTYQIINNLCMRKWNVWSFRYYSWMYSKWSVWLINVVINRNRLVSNEWSKTKFPIEIPTSTTKLMDKQFSQFSSTWSQWRLTDPGPRCPIVQLVFNIYKGCRVRTGFYPLYQTPRCILYTYYLFL